MKKAIWALLALIPVTSLAKDIPLPPAVMQAKTVYVEKGQVWTNKKDPTGDKSFLEPCIEELSKWGRFTLVSDSKAADLILQISTSQQTSTVLANDQISNSVNGATVLQALEPSSGKVLWVGSKDWGKSWSLKSSAVALVKQLRKQVEEQENAK